MEFEVRAQPGLSERVAFWRTTAERVIEAGGFAPTIARFYLTDAPATVPGFEELGQSMESVALAAPKIAPQGSIVLDVVESDRLLQGEEAEQAAVAAAIVREEAFHARDFAALHTVPKERLADHVDAAGMLQNTHGLHSLLEVRVLEDHLTHLSGMEEWFLSHYKVPWAKHVWNGLRNRMLVFRKRHTDLKWVEGNVGGMQDLFFRFAETFVPLQRHMPEFVEVVAITRFAEFHRVRDALAAFDAIYQDGFRTLPADGTALAKFNLTGRVQEEVLTPWLQKLVAGK
jgi:hypothetical protein